MTGPCLCGDTYCMSCGGICPKCEGEGYKLPENITDEEYAVFSCLKENEKDANYTRCSCNPTDEELEARNNWYLEWLMNEEEKQ